MFVRAFRKTGFRNPLNWYRNIDRNFALNAAYQGARIMQPALFITGERDPVRRSMEAAEKKLKESVPNLRETVVIEGAGHWVQQEAPGRVNEALVGFLKAL